MAEPKVRTIEPGSETARLMDEAEKAPLVLVLGGRRYRLEPEHPLDSDETDPSGNYDPERAIAGMKAAAGSWKDVDTEKLKADIRRWRNEGTRPPTRP